MGLLLAVWLLAGCGQGHWEGSEPPDAGWDGRWDGTTAGADGAQTGDAGVVDGDSGSVWPTCDGTETGSGFHVTVTGTPDGDGSLEHPWDLQTGLRFAPGVRPGDTVWIHEGRYEGNFVLKYDGQQGAPVTIRAWPGDRVVLDAAGSEEGPVLNIYHSWIVVRDLEITDSDPDRRSSRPTGIYIGGDHITLVNLVIHDVGTGISGGRLTPDGSQEGTNMTIYGCILFNNGWVSDGTGHGPNMYPTNRDSILRIEDNVLFYAYGFGIQNYSYSDKNYVRHSRIRGNVWFLNGAPGGKLYDNCLVGHDGTLTVEDILLEDNYGWALDLEGRDVRLGWDTANTGAVVRNNYFVGRTIFQGPWTDVTLEGNTFVGELQGLDPAVYPNNTYLSEPPGHNLVVVRPNRYEPGRAHIVVFNWEERDEVQVDLSGLLPAGTPFRVWSVQDVLGDPVLEGVYAGGLVALPMAGTEPVQPIGDPQAIPEQWRTGRRFNVFLLRAAVCEGSP